MLSQGLIGWNSPSINGYSRHELHILRKKAPIRFLQAYIWLLHVLWTNPVICRHYIKLQDFLSLTMHPHYPSALLRRWSR